MKATKKTAKAKPFQERMAIERKADANMARPHPKPSQKAAMKVEKKGGKAPKSSKAR